MYGPETLALLGFVTQARRLGFRLEEIKRIVVLKRSGRTPCKHVLDLVHLKLSNIDQALTDLAEVRGQLRGLLRSWRSRPTPDLLAMLSSEHPGAGEPPQTEPTTADDAGGLADCAAVSAGSVSQAGLAPAPWLAADGTGSTWARSV